jgi:hypothetical protein
MYLLEKAVIALVAFSSATARSSGVMLASFKACNEGMPNHWRLIFFSVLVISSPLMDVLVRTNDWEMWARDSQTKKKPLSKKLLIFSRDLFDTVDINSGRKRKKDRQGKRVSVQNSDHNISNYYMAILTFILI